LESTQQSYIIEIQQFSLWILFLIGIKLLRKQRR
jgi:hypothetical protein